MTTKVEYEYKGINPNLSTVFVPGGGAMGTTKAFRTLDFTPIVINLTEDIDSDVATVIAEKLAEAERNGQPFVPMYIHSSGGCTYSLMSIVESIRQCKVPVYTFCTALAASAAACIFSCGKRRIMGKYAKLLLHDVSVDFGEESTMTTSNLKVEAKEMRGLNRKIFRIISENTGKDPNFFVNVVKGKRNNDIYVDSRQALKWNLATDIGYPVLKVMHYIEMKCDIKSSSGTLKTNVENKELDEPPVCKISVSAPSKSSTPSTLSTPSTPSTPSLNPMKKCPKRKHSKRARKSSETSQKELLPKKKKRKKVKIQLPTEDSDTDFGMSTDYSDSDDMTSESEKE